MARIRTIKPEFCTSEQLAECSVTARLLFVEMWMFCDDGGRHPASTRRLKMECFPGDAFTDEQMQGFIGELLGEELLIEYEFEGKRYWQVTGWNHQRIDKPSYKYGPFDEEEKPAEVEEFVDHSRNGSRAIQDRLPPEGNGKERSRKEGNGKEVDSTSRRTDDAFDRFWEVVHRKEGKQAARKAWKRAVAVVAQEHDWPIPRAVEYLISRMERFADSKQASDPVKGTLHPSTWLSEGRYDDADEIWDLSPSEGEELDLSI